MFKRPDGSHYSTTFSKRPFGMRINAQDDSLKGAVVTFVEKDRHAHECGVEKDFVFDSVAGIPVGDLEYDDVVHLISKHTQNIQAPSSTIKSLS